MQQNLLEARSTYATRRNMIKFSNNHPYDKLLTQLVTNKCTKMDTMLAQYKPTDHIYKHTNLTDDRFMEVLFNNIQL